MDVGAVLFGPRGTDGMWAELRTTREQSARVEGVVHDVEPSTISGDESLTANRALMTNLWAYALHEKQRRLSRSAMTRESLAKQVDVHERVVLVTGELVGLRGSNSRSGWCSACFTYSDHDQVQMSRAALPAYLCRTCGSPTLTCAAPRCSNMAARGLGARSLPRYCAEHRHEVPSFEKATKGIGDLGDFEVYRKFERPNLARGTRVLGVATLLAGVTGGTAYYFAPLLGGVVGTLVSTYGSGTALYGAAASSYGLALLGGGSIAAGGLGMAGGTAVVTAVGGALGSAIGSTLATAYVGQDKSFRIEVLRPTGTGVPVVLANGFLTENDSGWAEWQELVDRRYPDSPVYRVHWGAKELGSLLALVGGAGSKAAAIRMALRFGLKANRSMAAKASPIGPGIVLVDLLKNPWHTAKERADKTGAVLADLLARTEAESYVLIGHSLGARVMAVATETLATAETAPTIETVHLLGAAAAADGDWRRLGEGVSDAVYCYHSRNDKVLRFLYRFAQAGEPALGLAGFTTRHRRLKNRNVSRTVRRHSDYFSQVKLGRPRSR